MKTLSIDHGEKRIGFAISDEDGYIATPLRQRIVSTNVSDIQVTIEEINEHNPDQILVGVPLGLEGKETQQSRRISAYINKIKMLTIIPILTWNESYSSVQAKQIAKKKRTRDIDSESARIILQEYLDFKNTGI